MITLINVMKDKEKNKCKFIFSGLSRNLFGEPFSEELIILINEFLKKFVSEKINLIISGKNDSELNTYLMCSSCGKNKIE